MVEVVSEFEFPELEFPLQAEKKTAPIIKEAKLNFFIKYFLKVN